MNATSDYLTPEARARMAIDEQLVACGWEVQDYQHAAVAAARGVAVREVPTDAGPADYVLYVDSQAVGVIEAKKEVTTLTGVEPQTRKYQTAYPNNLPAFRVDGALPFGYESTGTVTHFTNWLDPKPTSRRVFAFHRPETLARWRDDYKEFNGIATLRNGFGELPDLGDGPPGLWPAQAEAIRNLEASFKANRPRALIQMATGAGKTFTAANVCYRLLRHAQANRILFLVDRANLGRQAVREFQGFEVPSGHQKFTELYNARRLTSSQLDMANEAAAKVHISTIQRLYSILRGEELDEDLDERTGFDTALEQPVEVAYNPRVPIESYDLIIIDECHRSIYGVWRQVLEYFDAFLVGLTATPGIQTFAFFDQNLVMEYDNTRAVADRVNVDFDIFRIRTEITEAGSTVPAGFVTEFRDRETRSIRLEQADADIDYNAAELDKKVVAPDQIRTIVRTFRNSLPEMFEDRERNDEGLLVNIPKTLIFAKDDSHADDIVQIVREEFGLGNQGAVKITYRSGESGESAEQLLQKFRTDYPTRIAVTVDMIATGTDVKPIECVVFMRMVRSRNFFEQMKGRGVRVIDSDHLRTVTPDAQAKEYFVIVDAVGVTEADLHDTVPLERQRHATFDQLLNQIGLGVRDPDVVSSVASRLARLERRITAEDRAEVESVAGVELSELVRQITDALDPDRQHDAAAAETGTDDPAPEHVAAAAQRLIAEAVQPLAGNPQLREKLVDIRRSYEQVIDTASRDRVITGEFSVDAADRARTQVESWKQFIEDHKDEITALEVLYSQPYGADLKGDAYEGLIEKTAQEGARGAGQYFTPRALISAIVDVMLPDSGDRICDPACGTGGFFLGAYQSIVERFPHLTPEQAAHLRSGAFTGWEIADLPARLCAMNLLLHGIESPESDSPINVDDALRDDPGQRFDMVLTNPPFGRSSSDSYEREDFWATTKNKQLNFVQHVVSLLKVGGTAAVVVPDNVLFEAGAGETIRRRLLHDCDVHTLLRLPTGIFYAQGVKANVLFFRRREGAEQAWTKELWVYDLRTNKHFTLKQNPLTTTDLDDFVACYNPANRHQRQESERFKRYTYDELIARDKVSLDLFWLRDESLEDIDNLPAPAVLAAEIAEDLQSALTEIQALGVRLT